ncbi:IclR family transcriptional regulator [Alloalcanivorax mobilis]|uniref:IclR family transcriptional regulator n=1 Tax=Alloalcanivorax mobilis TaxID=2019569 RepID=UPI000B5B3F59|nr:IclR family transcriptional regulator [Alloalcanivorax mobilis]ASK35193.1 IclR family transcriptional regulator [Alcanivorax sp. N3-2A]|tara:strand:- start:31951 stop:32739 length:789 start_codon:yes stop_codon:yes gene_type:complete
MTTQPARSDADSNEKNTRVLRVLSVMERVAAASQPVTVSQLAQRLGIPKATLSRLLVTLVEHQYLGTLPGHGYVLGPRATRLALTTLGSNDFMRACRSVLRALVQRLGETCNLTALDGDRVIYIERVETSEPLRLHIEPGTRLPLHCTAGGKMFLGQMPRHERQALIERLPLTRMTPRTFTDPERLAVELERLAAQGIGVDNEEFVRGMVGVAVPVRDDEGKVLAAMVCHAATARASLDDLLRHLPHLRDAATSMYGLMRRL